ncbi:xanthine dehydrogenase family protein molybdopterin-binding subunit [uncultured Bradyrhizobium sp.]|uniref:xanthine dehydrogenase family protein molybdopterin-binding subunit n=1 Tax=uncultured Bradyrhizobium sp. TaxID=199684 RepID=UPI0035CB3CBB
MAPYIGTPTSRVDGHAKVTGAAKYAGEFGAPDLAYGNLVTSTIASGRIVSIDISEASSIAGVIAILTHKNRPPMADDDGSYKDDVAPENGSPYRPLYDDKIQFSGQPVAIVLAEDWETAHFAATRVRVAYEEQAHVTSLRQKLDQAKPAGEPPKPRGSAEKALAAAAVRHEADYFVPIEHHNAMELFASTVIREADGKLTVYDKTQGVQNVHRYLCGVFRMKPDEVRVMSPFTGGAFGSGLRPQHQVTLAVLAARALQRSVRLVLTRQQTYTLGFRPGTVERVALGAGRDGSLEAVEHDVVAMTSQYEDFARNDTGWSGALYTCANTKYSHRLAKLDIPTPCDMRAPGAATGMYALECAMDELAVALKMDPLQLRLRNYSDRQQDEDKPYTSKELRECYAQAAEAFGWSKRSSEPRSMREGTELVGWGMASGVWEALQMETSARIVLTANGHAEVACATSDIGTGTYTIMAQVAADMLGLPINNVSVKLGDSSLPASPVEGGSWMAASVSHAIKNAADALRKDLLALAQKMPDSPLAGVKLDDVVLADGKIVSRHDAGRAVSIADAIRYGKLDRIEQEQSTTFEDNDKYARNAHSAVFAEVKIDEQLGVIRVTRIVSAVAAGRILNTKTAASQIMGGMIWGIGMALHEETHIDHRFGRIMNANYAEYHVPVNADVHDIKVIFVEEKDDIINPLGIKGVGEIGLVGVASAIANAVYHATGKRVRDLPITLDKLGR